jgi:small subunit ribosomal protein S23e
MGSHKPRGLSAARKLKNTRRDQRWADKTYNKAHLGNEYNKPFAAASHAKGIVLEKIGVEAKQPNSAIRKCVRVQLIKNGKKVAAFVPNDGCLSFIDENVSNPTPPRPATAFTTLPCAFVIGPVDCQCVHRELVLLPLDARAG